MAQHFKDTDLFPVANKSSQYVAEFETLKEKKEKTVETIKVTQDLCLTIRPKLLKLVASQLKVESMQMLIKSCKKLHEFFKMNLKYQSALRIDHSIVTDPMIAIVKEGLTLVLYNAGLI